MQQFLSVSELRSALSPSLGVGVMRVEEAVWGSMVGSWALQQRARHLATSTNSSRICSSEVGVKRRTCRATTASAAIGLSPNASSTASRASLASPMAAAKRTIEYCLSASQTRWHDRKIGVILQVPETGSPWVISARIV